MTSPKLTWLKKGCTFIFNVFNAEVVVVVVDAVVIATQFPDIVENANIRILLLFSHSDLSMSTINPV